MRRFIKTKIFWVAVFVGLILALTLAAARWSQSRHILSRRARPTPTVTVEAPPVAVSWLDGRPLSATSTPLLAAVMVENHLDARPLSGLADARLVFEAPVEGGITRLLAVYDLGDDLPEIGPVRSARPYFLDWARELDALYVHVGGSPAALDRLAGGGLRHLNQFFQDKYFWRAVGRGAPHNVYTSTARLRQAESSRVASSTSVTARATAEPHQQWRFSAEPPSGELVAATTITIPFSTPAYRVRWQWDEVAGVYRRFVGGASAADSAAGGGRSVTAANVAVVYAATRVVDEIGRLELETRGSGRAILFRDGRQYAASWRKPSAAERLRFFLEDGAEATLRPGTTWIEVVPLNLAVRSATSTSE